MRSVPASARLRRAPNDSVSWNERAARLFTELERPAKAMVRRAYRGAFGDDELDDVYNGAWVGTLRALASRHAKLTDSEIRSYVFTAVAHQAGKEIRRRKRRPTAPLEHAAAVADTSPALDDRAGQNEDSQVTRDLLASLPRRRRAVLMLRYGWGLDPAAVCELVKGLSPRAYRKEITRGVDELTEKLKRFETGEWCADREPILKAYAAGLADSDQKLQAQQHLSHCRSCSDFVAKLSGHLHDLGSALAVPGVVDAVGGEDRMALADRLGDVTDRMKEPVVSLVGRGGSPVADQTGQLSSAGGLRGVGTVGAGITAKLAGVGAAGKIAVACLGGGAAATACVAAGISPFGPAGDNQPRQERPASKHRDAPGGTPVVENRRDRESVDSRESEPKPEPAPESQPVPEPTPPSVTPTLPPPEQVQEPAPTPARIGTKSYACEPAARPAGESPCSPWK